MSRLDYRQQKIQEKRKQTPWREFVMEITPWISLNLYKLTVGISRYPQTERIGIVMDHKDYEKQYPQGPDGVEYISEKPFLFQFMDFFLSSPKSSKTTYGDNENCDFSEVVFGAKDCYLSFIVGNGAEKVIYGIMCYDQVYEVFSSVSIIRSQHIYFCKSISESYNIFYSKFIHNSSNLRFSSNCVGCSECILCDGLENKSYCIHNEEYEKDEYLIEKATILSNKSLFDQYFNGLTKSGNIIASTNVVGSTIKLSENVENGIQVFEVKNARNVFCVDFGTYYYDTFDAGMNAHYLYAVAGAGQNCEHLYCCANQSGNSHIFYSYFLESCSYCLGCIGLKNKSYCILNKQYTKEERYEKVDEIFGQMEKESTLGQFFPATMNPFYFNDTAAYLIDPSFTKEEVTAKGYLRRDEPIKVDIPAGVQTVKTSELDQFEGFDAAGNRTISDEILKKVILDEQGNAYRVIPMELEFLRKYGLPLPRKHRLERMKENFRIS